MSNKKKETTGKTDIEINKTSEKSDKTNKLEEPKISDAIIKIGKSLLEVNSSITTVYMTSDGRGFYEKNDADNYARILKNKVITPVKK